jgi:glycosyl transferase, family 25
VSTNRADIRITIIVISLPHAVSRRQVVEQYLSKINLPWRFFEAIRYRSDSSENDKGVRVSNLEVDEGNVGCFLSHHSVWKEIKELDVDYAIVLEDDTVLIPSLDYCALFSLLREIGIDFIRLTTHQIERAITLARLGPLYGLLYRVTNPRHGHGTGCYAVTPRAAEMLYAAVSRIQEPIDLWLECYRNHSIPIYNLFPAAAIEIRSQSQITPKLQRPATLIDYALKRLERGFEDGVDQWRLSRLDDALRKRIDRLHPGMAVWPHSELRKHLRKLMRVGGDL